MKIIGTDNYDRESIAEVLHSEGYEQIKEAHRICKRLNEGLGDNPGLYYHVVPDDRRLWRGMEELI